MPYILRRSDARRRCGMRGIALVELMVCTVVVVVSLLGYAATVFRQHESAAYAEERGVAVLTLQRFVERLRAETDWPGLYARLRPLSSEGARDATLSSLGPDPSLTTYAPSAYYPDFDVPARLGTVTVLVQVPSTSVSAVAGLRENANAPRYGLPADLNGDGVTDGDVRDADYAVLPVVVRLRWQRPGRDSDEVVVAACLRGDQ